jgi:catechol 2,3-dioxygenase-like lactoylglutathione lyase family enzyme
MLGVAAVADAVEFYRDRLGLDVRFEMPGFAFLDGGGVTLALSEPLAKNRGGVTAGLEIVFGVGGVRQAYAQLQERGVEFLNEPRNVDGTNWAANFHDPDGYLLSIYGPE